MFAYIQDLLEINIKNLKEIDDFKSEILTFFGTELIKSIFEEIFLRFENDYDILKVKIKKNLFFK